MANIYDAIYTCNNTATIVTLDGDDWFAHNNVLAVVNKYYTRYNASLTYGQFEQYPMSTISKFKALPQHIITKASYRGYPWQTSHLRIFYAWLFKNIKKEDLMYEGKFFPMAWDLAFMFPMLEMSGTHSKFIAQVLYIYNMQNPINDHKVNGQLQKKLDRFIRSKAKYPLLTSKP